MTNFEPTPTGDEAIDVVFKRLQQAMRGQSTVTAGDIAAGDAATLAAANAHSDGNDADTLDEALTGQQRAQGLFFQTFEDPVEADWDVQSGGGSITYPNNGVAGGKALNSVGEVWLSYPNNIAMDPARLYRLRARVRLVTAPADPAKDNFYLMVHGVAADGVTLVNKVGADSIASQYYVVSEDMGSQGLGVWLEVTAYYKGTAATGTNGGATPQTAGKFHQDVRYIRPGFILNSSFGDGVMELDYLAIEVITVDEEVDATAITNGPALVAANQAATVFGQPFSNATIASLMSGSAIGEVQIEDDAITSPKIAANQILAGHILAGEITGDKIDANTVTAANIVAGTITGDEIAAATILAGNIGADEIVSGLIAADQILGSHIAAGQVDTLELAAGAITTTKLDALAVTAAKLAAGAIEAGKLDVGSINASNLFVSNVVGNAALGPDSVDSSQIANGAVNSGTMISNGVIVTNHMTAGSINGDRVSSNSIDTGQIAAGAILAGEIAANAVEAAKIKAGAVIAGKIGALAVDTAELAAGAITSGKIEANAIIAGKIAVGGVSGSTQIANGVVNTNQLAAFAVEAGKINAGAVTAGKIDVDNLSVDLNANIGGNLYLPSANNITWGTSASPTTISKLLLMPYSAFIPDKDYPTGTADKTWEHGGGYLDPGNYLSIVRRFVAPFWLPSGAIITSIRLRGYRGNSSQTVVATIVKVNDSGSESSIGASALHQTTGWTTVSDSCSETVGSQPYTCTLSLIQTTSGYARVAWVKIYYSVHNLREAL